MGGVSPEVVVVIPVVSRPHRVLPVLDTAVTYSHPHRVRVLFVCSPGTPDEYEELDFHEAEYMIVPWGPGKGDYAKKINYAIERTDEPLIFMGADDLRFHEGWLDACLRYTPDFAVVGTNDLGNPLVAQGIHSTHSLVRRDYVEHYGTIDEPGKALHEGYWHEFVDDEFVRTAMYRNQFVFAADAIVEHLHPHWGKAPTDAIYEGSSRRLRWGRRLYRRRAHLWGEDPPAR